MSYGDGAEFTAAADTTLYAQWTETTYTYEDPTYVWSSDYTTCTATAVCVEDPTQNKAETVNTTSAVTTEPTCETAGVTTYTATFTEAPFTTQTKTVNIPALGHDYGAPAYTWSGDNAQCTATKVCSHDESHVITETVNSTSETTAATCETAGTTVYTATFTKEGFQAQTKSVTIPAIGHDYGEPEYVWANDNSAVTATTVCRHDPDHVITETVQTTSQTTAATCEADGQTVYTATFTKDPFTTQTKLVVIPASGHNWDNGVVTTEPTCTADGIKTFTCTVCGETRTETVPALGHDLSKTEAKTATCTESGNIEYWTCNRCGKLFSDAEGTTEIVLAETVINALGHAWDNGVITAEPTCTETGVKTFTCTRCGETRTEAVPALAHDLTKTEAKAATCTEVGNIEYWTCQRCGKIFSDAAGATEITLADTVIQATDHNYGEPTYEWAEDNSTVTAKRICANDPSHVDSETVNTTSEVTKPATCEEKGETTYTAAFANSVFATQTKTVDNIDALGHDWQFTGLTWEGSDVDGYAATAGYKCKNNEEHTRSVAAAMTTETKDATCTTPGTVTYVATISESAALDGVERTDSKVVTGQALGHDYQLTSWNWADDLSSATATFTCTRDANHVETVTAEMSANTTPATCEETGSVVHIATVTFEGKEYTNSRSEEIAALGHAWDEGVVTTEPTCTETGVKTFTCTRCGETRTETIEALGHNLTKTEGKAATCAETGNIAYWTCERCGKLFSDAEGTTEITLSDTVIDALGHAWDEGVVTTEPTCTETGVQTFTCTRCGETRTETIEALGHNLTKTEAKASTCTETGNIEYWTCER
jgi:DNA-directed RNA polymerase subunit RPC12/RpoP